MHSISAALVILEVRIDGVNRLQKKQYDMVWLNINRSCNNRCNFCYARDSILSRDEMDYSEVYRLLPILRELNIKKIILIGGEPTLYPHILEIVNAITEYGMNCTVQSNGLRFADYDFLKDMITAGMMECGISIKGFSKEEYEQTTETYNFPLMIKAIENFYRLNYEPMFSYVLPEPSIRIAEQLVVGVKKLGLKNIYISPVHPTCCEQENYFPPNYMKWVDVYRYIISRLSKCDVKFSFGISFPLCAFPEEEIVSYMHQGIVRKNCCQAVLENGLVFDTDFRLLPCNMFVKKPFIKDQKKIESVYDIFEIMDASIVRDYHEHMNTPLTEKCQECYRWSQCHAGCRARWEYKRPEDEITGFRFGKGV